MPFRNIHNVEITRATRGWVCKIYFAVPTRRQFTSEWHTVKGGHKHLVPALIRGFVAAKREYRRLQSLPGKFKLS